MVILKVKTFQQGTSQEHAIQERTNRRSSPAGFTLIELLMVITIIAVLLAMLIPAVYGVITAARIAEARTEISGLQTALTEFKSKYDVYPPSSIRLSETAAGWNIVAADSPALKKLKAESIASIREIFGTSFDFARARDINGNGAISGSITLTGAECLVFFLGGVFKPRTSNTDPFDHIGFSNNPADPFSRAGSSRVSFFLFDTGRFTNLQDPSKPIDSMPEYKDPLPDQVNPYWYVSISATGTYKVADLTGSRMNNVYSSSATIKYKAKSYQIISPGFDTLYGTGGIFDPNGSAGNLSIDDADNLTNFHPGKLGN